MYNDYYDYVPRTTNPAPFLIVSIILAIIGTVLAFIFLLPESKRPKLNSFFKSLADIFNFKSLLIEKILKFTYILATLFAILYGFFMLFMQTYGQSMALAGILVIIFAPIAIRLTYEITMMFVIMLRNVIEINKKLDVSVKNPCETENVVPEVSNKTSVDKCAHCNATIEDKNANFCKECGTKIEH